MQNLQLLPSYIAVFVASVARLRWLALTNLRCHGCAESHLECDCKPAWVKLLL